MLNSLSINSFIILVYLLGSLATLPNSVTAQILTNPINKWVKFSILCVALYKVEGLKNSHTIYTASMLQKIHVLFI